MFVAPAFVIVANLERLCENLRIMSGMGSWCCHFVTWRNTETDIQMLLDSFDPVMAGLAGDRYERPRSMLASSTPPPGGGFFLGEK